MILQKYYYGRLMNKKKILMVLTRCPYPINGGRESILAQTIDFLSDEYDLDILYFSKNNTDKNEFDKRGIKAFSLNFPSKMELILNIVTRRNFSLQENLFYSNNNLGFVSNFIEKNEPDLIYVDMIRVSQYIEDLEIPKIIDIDDLLSIRYTRFIEQKESSILGTFSKIIPSLIRDVVEKLFKNTILKHESNKMFNREKDVVYKYNSCFLVSKKEKDTLKNITKNHNIFTNTQAIKSRKNIYTNPDENNLLFIGNMLTAQNKASLKIIVTEILPKFKFEYKLFVLGNYNKDIQELTSLNNNIKLLGFVDNLEDVLKTTKLALMPIAFGTGIKTKILDCMSYGVPVLTNTVGNEGLSTRNMNNILIFENNDLTNDNIEKLLNNNKLLEEISKNEYQYIIDNHNFDKLRLAFVNIIKENIK